MNWFAIYTKSRFEKKVYSLLSEQSIEVYLPLHKRMQHWSDRKKWVEVPLIRSYVFVRVTEKEYFQVLNTAGVVCYVSFGGKAAPIRNSEIETLKKILATDIEVELSTDKLLPGEPIEIVAGRLLGIHGELIEYRGNKKVVIKISDTGHSLLLTIPIHYLRRTTLALVS